MRVESTGVPHNPDQFAMIAAANPVARNRCVLSCGFLEQPSERVESLLRNRGLPCPFAAALGELIENPSGFSKRPFAALRQPAARSRRCSPQRFRDQLERIDHEV